MNRPHTLTVVKCACRHTQCTTYGFKEGTFYQGCGFDKETAERIAEVYNVSSRFDEPVAETINALVAFVQDTYIALINQPPNARNVKIERRAREILQKAGVRTLPTHGEHEQ